MEEAKQPQGQEDSGPPNFEFYVIFYSPEGVAYSVPVLKPLSGSLLRCRSLPRVFAAFFKSQISSSWVSRLRTMGCH